MRYLGWIRVHLVCGQSRFDPHIWQHSFVEFGHEIISTAILSLLLIQDGQFSITGERTCIKYWYKRPSPYVTSFRRRFFKYNHVMTHPHSNIILSLFSIPLVLKCAAKIFNIGLQIKI